jgi:biopolymer transport protein ExbB/TolQ
MFETVIRFFQEGGAFMMPTAIVLVIGLAIAIERAIYLLKVNSVNAKSMKFVQPLLKAKNLTAIAQLKQDSALNSIMATGVLRWQQSSHRDEIESAMEECVMETVPGLEKRTSYLATLANISTLLGLLGTIIGLIAAFSAVANAAPAEKAALLSQSISVAMNTTAFGLIAAIPLLVFHSILQTKTTEIVDKLEMFGVKLLNVLSSSDAVQTKSRQTD